MSAVSAPCQDWDVGLLFSHIIVGQETEEAAPEPRYDPDHVVFHTVGQTFPSEGPPFGDQTERTADRFEVSRASYLDQSNYNKHKKASLAGIDVTTKRDFVEHRLK